MNIIAFRPETSDSGSAADANRKTTGIVAGTHVATTNGWRPVEAIIPGERILTFDGGLQPVLRVKRARLWSRARACPRRSWPLTVPSQALGNNTPMTLLPDQPVMLESDAAEDISGDPFALLPAEALEGFRGIARIFPEESVEIVTLYFEIEQVVFANIGARFLCPADDVDADGDSELDGYVTMSLKQATRLTRAIADGEANAAEAAFVNHSARANAAGPVRRP